jgi:hypothetical protein
MITNLRTVATVTHKGARVRDAAGTGWIDGTPETAQERIAIRAASAKDLEQASALSVKVDTVLTFRAAATIRRGDLVTAGGITYTVQSVPEQGLLGRAVKSAYCTTDQAGR